MTIVPEQYDEYGLIIPQPDKPVVYERKLTGYQQHRLHETKDLFESNCTFCQVAAQKRIRSYWKDDE